MKESRPGKWLVLIHQIPPKPDYLRVKIWRRLQDVGAVPIKQSVYVMPNTDHGLEDLSWILKEIIEGGGEGYIAEMHFVGGISSDEVQLLFQSARDADYRAIGEEAQAQAEAINGTSNDLSERPSKGRAQLSHLKRRLQHVISIDFFKASRRQFAEDRLAFLESQLRTVRERSGESEKTKGKLKAKTWVTRADVYIDRIACAWLIKRFINRKATFKFVAGRKYRPQANEARFDMFEAEFTHEGDRCTFEVMIERFHLQREPLTAIAEIIHDIDLKEGKFKRNEVPGIQALFNGLVMTYRSDRDRIKHGSEILNFLYQHYERK